MEAKCTVTLTVEFSGGMILLDCSPRAKYLNETPKQAI